MAYNFKDVTILIVDDNFPMLTLLKAMLTKFGVGTIVTASNGDIAFNKYCKYNPDIVISDWMMDPSDGVDLAREIRVNKSSPNPYVPFILMTGFSEEHRVISARDVGITEFLLKPFSAVDLYKRLVTIIEAPRQFVKSEDFFGPDRRRRRSGDFDGGWKRRDDIAKPVSEIDVKVAQKRIDEVKEAQGIDKSDDILLEDKVIMDEKVTDIDLVGRDDE